MALTFARSLLFLWIIGLADSATVLTNIDTTINNIDTTIQPTVQIGVEDEYYDEEYEEGFEEDEEEEIDLSGKDMVLEAVGKVGNQ